MIDAELIAFLQWALPHLGRRWAGYRKVRRLVAKRLRGRLRTLGLVDLDAYRGWLTSHDEEWAALDALLGIPISRFYRDREVFESIEQDVFPALAQAGRRTARRTLACWSAGCASGEEPYTLAILWRLRLQAAYPDLTLQIIASDSDAGLVERARAGYYQASSLKELPAGLQAAAFEASDAILCLRREYRIVEFLRQDLRKNMPAGPFDLVLLRNVVATYYAPDVQRAILLRIASRLQPGACLVLGLHEMLPDGLHWLEPWPRLRAAYRRVALSDQTSKTPLPGSSTSAGNQPILGSPSSGKVVSASSRLSASLLAKCAASNKRWDL